MQNHELPTEAEPRLIWPGQIVGMKTAMERYGLDRSTIVRRIWRGEIVPLAKVDGGYVFDTSDLPPRLDA